MLSSRLFKHKPLQNIITRNHHNILLRTDVYKMGHAEQYVKGCEKVYSYLQARSTKTFTHCLFFGLQYYLKNYLSKPITMEMANEFLKVRKQILGTESPEITQKISSLAKLGYWPLEIKAVPEGTLVDNKNVLMTITNTIPGFHWTVGFVESLLLKVWYPCTVATTSFEYRKVVERFFRETVDDYQQGLIKPFMVHDFGYRGDSSEESASISGAAHALSFTGSDTVLTIPFAKNFYDAEDPIIMSVPASEHSVMCSFGRENELDAYKHMLEKYKTGIVSIVSDTYNLWTVLTDFAVKLKPAILARNGKVVFRPDSGDPVKIICGNPDANVGTPEYKGALRLLDEVFGSTVNSKGYKVLNSKVGLIYGDGMYLARYIKALETIKEMGYSAQNLVIGVGAILRNHTRDTMGFAIKASFVEVNGVNKAIQKDPITDPGKKSHSGLMILKHENNKFVTEDNVAPENEKYCVVGCLKQVFYNGKVMKPQTFDQIRERVKEAIKD